MTNLDQLELFEPGITYRATCLRLVDEGRTPTLEAVRKAIQEALMESKKSKSLRDVWPEDCSGLLEASPAKRIRRAVVSETKRKRKTTRRTK